MSIGYGITEHDKVFINEEGKEVYPPGHPHKGVVKPASERKRDPSLPPKSKAEERLEMSQKIDDEAKKAMDLLTSKGLNVTLS